MKRTDLEKLKALKLRSDLRGSAVPDRFAGGHAEAATRREQRELDRARGLVPFAVKLEGELVNRQEVERAVYGRARFERDAWTGWASRAAVAVAAEAGGDPGRTFAALDRLVREHLDDLSRTAWDPTG